MAIELNEQLNCRVMRRREPRNQAGGSFLVFSMSCLGGCMLAATYGISKVSGCTKTHTDILFSNPLPEYIFFIAGRDD